MSKRNVVAVYALAIAAAAWSPARAQGIGAAYGSRNPVTCAPVKGGSITAAQAQQLFVCNLEKEMGTTLYLIQDAKVEIASSRKWQSSDTYNDIDTNAPVYPIRASYTWWACRKVNSANAGKNCSSVDEPGDQGICYKNTFGEWACKTRPVKGWDSAKTGLAGPR